MERGPPDRARSRPTASSRPATTGPTHKFFTPENRRRVLDSLEKVRPIAEKHGVSLAQMVINWTIQEPGITAAIVGARNAEQAEHNAGALSFRLSPEECAEIRQAFDATSAAMMAELSRRSHRRREFAGGCPALGRSYHDARRASYNTADSSDRTDTRRRDAQTPWRAPTRPSSGPSTWPGSGTPSSASTSTGALERLATVAVSLHCWQGDDVGGFEGDRRGARRRPGRHRELSGQGPDARRAAGRPREGLRADPRHAPAQPPRQLRRDRRHDGRARRAPARALPRLDRLGEGAGARDRLQPDLLRPPEGRRRLHPGAPRRGRSAGSGSTTGSPAGGSARRSARRSGRPASPTSGSPTARRTRPSTARALASGWRSRSTRSSPSRSTRGSTATPSRASCSASGSESYVVGSHEFYLGYAITRETLLCLDAGHFHPTEVISDKISAVLDLARRGPAARQPGRPLGQRPRRHPDRRAAGDRPGGRPGRLPRPGPHRPRLLRRQHQPRRRLGDRHPGAAQGAADGPARADGDCCASCEAEGDLTARLALLEEFKTLPVRGGLGPLLPDARRAGRAGLAGRGRGATSATCCRGADDPRRRAGAAGSSRGDAPQADRHHQVVRRRPGASRGSRSTCGRARSTPWSARTARASRR